MKRTSLIPLFIILIVSCTGNSAYFDLETKGIISCNGAKISKITIREVGGNYDSYRFLLRKDRHGIGVDFFSVKEINKAFIIYSGIEEIIPNEEFKLKPLTTYEILNHSNGDAAPQIITIMLDEKGKIIKVDKSNCD